MVMTTIKMIHLHISNTIIVSEIKNLRDYNFFNNLHAWPWVGTIRRPTDNTFTYFLFDKKYTQKMNGSKVGPASQPKENYGSLMGPRANVTKELVCMTVDIYQKSGKEVNVIYLPKLGRFNDMSPRASRPISPAENSGKIYRQIHKRRHPEE